MRGPDMQRLREIAYRALPLGHLPQVRYQPGGRVGERMGVRLIDWGDDLPDAGVAVALGETPPLATVLEIADAFFAGRPYGVRVDGDAGQPIEAALRARGWRATDDVPSMVMAPLATIPPTPVPLAIRHVVTEQALDVWYQAASPGARAPDDPPEVDYNRIFVPSLAVAQDPDVVLFIGELDGRAVASSALYVTDGIAEIGAVATWPDMRRRGYGAAMTWAAIAEGVKRGCTAAALRATEMGESVYAAMGFVDVCTFRTYRRS